MEIQRDGSPVRSWLACCRCDPHPTRDDSRVEMHRARAALSRSQTETQTVPSPVSCAYSNHTGLAMPRVWSSQTGPPPALKRGAHQALRQSLARHIVQGRAARRICAPESLSSDQHDTTTMAQSSKQQIVTRVNKRRRTDDGRCRQSQLDHYWTRLDLAA